MESKSLLKVLDRYVDKALEKYFCSKCETFHKRYTKGNLSATFFSHYDYRQHKTPAQIWKRQFIKSWNKEALRQTKNKHINEA